jgi:hypothetical protein
VQSDLSRGVLEMLGAHERLAQMSVRTSVQIPVTLLWDDAPETCALVAELAGANILQGSRFYRNEPVPEVRALLSHIRCIPLKLGDSIIAPPPQLRSASGVMSDMSVVDKHGWCRMEAPVRRMHFCKAS